MFNNTDLKDIGNKSSPSTKTMEVPKQFISFSYPPTTPPIAGSGNIGVQLMSAN